jgi:hypothetical protein
MNALTWIFGILFLLSLAAALLGLFRPEWVLFRSKQPRTRTRAVASTLVVAAIALVMFLVLNTYGGALSSDSDAGRTAFTPLGETPGPEETAPDMGQEVQ